jgi:hypothetical protein
MAMGEAQQLTIGCLMLKSNSRNWASLSLPGTFPSRTQNKRIVDFQNSENSQVQEAKKAEEIFLKIAELHLPPFNVTD